VVKTSKRRGISTIVGGLIFLILMTSAFSTFYIAFDFQQETINTQRDVSRDLVEKTQEQFVISAGADPNDNNRLGIQVKNQGPNPVEVANIWIVNKSDVNEPANRYEVNYQDVFIPPGYGAPILENTPLYLNPAYGNDYTVKVISTLGSIKSVPVTTSGSTNLLAEMFTIPPDVRQGENVTVALRVTNVGDTPLVDVEPHYIPPDVKPLSEIDTSEFISPSPVTLDPTESTIFTWHYKVKNTAVIGSKVSFTSAANATDSATGFDYLSNNATDNIIIRDPQGGSGEEIVIKDELFAKPDIFMIVPSTFGESDDDEGLWGITVANPTDATMYVSKVSVTILYAGANSNQEIFTVGCNNRTPIFPAIDYFDCPNDNSLVWYDKPAGAYKQPIPPRSAYTFLLTVEPGKTTGPPGDALDSVIVHTAVFTSLGAFGEAKWTSAVVKGDDAIANVYLVDTGQDPTLPPNMRGNRMGIPSASTQTFDIALADLNDDSGAIQAGAELIINIPKDWGLPTINPPTPGFTNLVVNQFPDNSYQIVGELIGNLNHDAEVISFDTVAPTVLCDKMYVMHVLANGITTAPSQKTIGPVGEIVLQVNPVGACP